MLCSLNKNLERPIHLNARSLRLSQTKLEKPHIQRRSLLNVPCSNNKIEFGLRYRIRAPHFGGLWEAAVKSAKTLVLKNIANAYLTFEELQTVFLDVEAILNSRPIAPASDDPNDFNALTPAHLLIGTELTSAPESSLHHSSDAPGKEMRYLDRWQRVTYLKQQFWSIWHRDYIHNLQQRGKWNREEPNLTIGQLVIVHEDNTPAQYWPLARIVSVTAGNDGKVRVAEVSTGKRVFTRPIHKLAPLPN
ncbi:uncharacterized protein [Drosophila takahashii]|uniref:uncharacterized protein n=1 Tax=Drosophila takahashii TaxID=29030 RepID=UPI003898E2FD